MLTRFSAWANKRLFMLLSALPNEVVTAKHPSSYESISKTLGHAYVVDLIWQAHLLGREHGFTTRNTDREVPMGVLVANQVALDQWYVDYADALTVPVHDEVVHFNFIDGGDSLSKRTKLYANAAKVWNDGRGRFGIVGATASQSATAAGADPRVLSLGITHSF